MTMNIIFCLAVYLAGVWASYVALKDICKSKKVHLLAIGSWLTFICYLIACSYNDFDKHKKV